MTDIWLPGYDKWPLSGVPGVPYDEWDDPKALLHMTQGTTINGAVSAYKAYPPHLIVDPVRKGKAQHIPLNRAAYALWNADADDSRCYQVEIVGYSENAPNMPDDQLKWLGEEVLLPLHEYGGVPLVVVWKGFKAPSDVNYMLATSSSPLRLTQAELDNFAGILGHQHIPDDDHWDPGGLRVGRMVEHAKNKLAGGDDELDAKQSAALFRIKEILEQDLQSMHWRIHALAHGFGTIQGGPNGPRPEKPEGDRVETVDKIYELLNTVRRAVAMLPAGASLPADDMAQQIAEGQQLPLIQAVREIGDMLETLLGAKGGNS